MIFERLQDIPLFQAFSGNSLKALANLAISRELQEGEAVFQEGDEGDRVYIIDRGEVSIVKRDRVLAVLPEGQMFGEMALFEREKRSAGAVATRPTTLYGIKNGEFLAFLFEHPQAGARFLFETVLEMSRRLRTTSEYLTTVFETGKIVGTALPPGEMTEKIIHRLLADVKDASGGMIILYNPFAESFEVACEVQTRLLNLEKAMALVKRNAGKDIFQEVEEGSVLGAALKDERGKVLGCILLEKAGDRSPFAAQQEIVVAAVGQQTGLGILQAYSRQEEEARQRLERSRMNRY